MRTRKKGKKWYFNFDIYINGKRKIIERVGGLTKKEAIKNGMKVQEEFLNNSNNLSDLKTMEDLIDDYIHNYINLFLKESIKKIRMYYFNIIKDEIGKVKLEKVNTKFFQNYILKKNDPNNYKKFLRSMFNYAIKMELITKNPIENIKTPKPKKRQFDLITKNDIKIIQKMNIREITKDLISFLYLTGTRISEALGLKWSDIDFNNMTISIRRAINKNKRNTFDTLKTATSQRTVLFNRVIEKIFMNRKKEIEILKKKSEGYYNTDLIFSNNKGNTFMISDFNKEKYKIKAQLNKNFTFHALRHTHATLLIENGIDLKTTQERLGHADITTTLKIYTHTTEKMKKTVIPILDNLLK